nr:helicase HerA-like domain-containing protein [Longimicrobium terrae]
MNPEVLAASRAAFSQTGAITLGAPVHEGQCAPEPVVTLPLSLMNRHGLIAGATGTGKTKTLQLIAEQLSAAGVPVFLRRQGRPQRHRRGGRGERTGQGTRGGDGIRVESVRHAVEYLSLSGALGAQMRATLSSFGPLLLARVLGLNATQTSVLTLVFKYCDDKGLLLLDLSDLRAALQYLSDDGADELKAYGRNEQADRRRAAARTGGVGAAGRGSALRRAGVRRG